MARRVVAIPLRGSIPCNTRPEKTRSPPQGRRNPLTGLNPLQPEAPEVNGPLPGLGSRNPLTGLNPLQPGKMPPRGEKGAPPVAIPLRGSIPCNGTPQRTPSWTAPPKVGFVRKMKLGICTQRIMGVFEGLHQWKATGERGDEKKKRIFAFRKGKTGFQDPRPEVRVGKSIAHTATLHQVKISAKKRLPK